MEKILVVDDEPGVLEVVQEVLSGAGYDVTGFSDPRKALEAIRSEVFDLVITDLKMPHVDGTQVTKAVKKEHKETEVIVITGYARLETAVDALKQDVYDYLLKPFNVSDILHTVQNVIESIRLRRQNTELHRKVEQALSDLTILHEVSKIINSSEEQDDILNFALGTIESSLGISMASIMLGNEYDGRFTFEKSIGFSKTFQKKFEFVLKEDIIGQAVSPSETISVAGYENDEKLAAAATKTDLEKMKSFTVIPLYSLGHLVGFITIHSLEPGMQDYEEKMKLLEVMAVNIAPMLQLAQYHGEREKLLHDSLFGARNELMNIIKKAGDYKGRLSILVFRLYLKKRENPEIRIFEVGDQLFANIQDMITPIDSALRIGLDTCMVILQGKTKILTEEIAARIKEKAEADKIIKQNGFLVDYGYADFPMDGQSFDVLVNKAQANLWKYVKS